MAQFRELLDRAATIVLADGPDGADITTARTDVDLVVTEYGVADLRGHDDATRARLLIEIAHPDHRSAQSSGTSRAVSSRLFGVGRVRG